MGESSQVRDRLPVVTRWTVVALSFDPNAIPILVAIALVGVAAMVILWRMTRD